MTAMMAMGIGLLMTAIAVAIGGLVIQATMMVIQYSLKTSTATVNEQASHAVVFHLQRREELAGSVEWPEKAAA